jgi:metal-responsive CopG/Arc/MetJ family transcriptional regulator
MARIKATVSLDKSFSEQIDSIANKMKVSRSRLFSMAVEDFLRHRENEQLLQDINKAYQGEPDQARQTQRQGMRLLHRKVLEGEW